MADLKPCPFCGGEARIGYGWPNYIFCIKCGARIHHKSCGHKGIKGAVKKWNRRVTDGTERKAD